MICVLKINKSKLILHKEYAGNSNAMHQIS